MALPTASTEAVSDFFVQEGQRISKDINQKHKAKLSPFLSIIPKEFWEDEIGESPQTFNWRRAGTVDEEVEWADIDMDPTSAPYTSDTAVSAGGSCIPPADEAVFYQDVRNFNLQHKAIWGPRICLNNIRSKFAMMQQMEATVKSLADHSRYVWITRNRDEYKRISNNKVIATVDGITFSSETSGDYGKRVFAIASTGVDTDYAKYSRMTNDITDYLYEYMNHQGAQDGALGLSSGSSVYGLITSGRQSRALIKEDPDAREDFRNSSQSDKLLEAMGVKYTYNGWTHLINDHVARYNMQADLTGALIDASLDASAGTVTFSDDVAKVYKGSEIVLYNTSTGAILDELYVTSRTSDTVVNVINSDGTATTANGDQTNVGFLVWKYVPEFLSGLANADWLTATFEDSYVFHQNAMTCLVPKPISSVGKAKFDPVDYSGTFRWTNYLNESHNPDGTIGRFRGVLSSGSRPDNPEFAVTIRHLSCAGSLNDLANCDGTASA